MKKSVVLFLCLIGLLVSYSKISNEPEQIAESIDLSALSKKYTGAEKFALYHSKIKQAPEGKDYTYSSGYLISEFEKAKRRSSNHSRTTINWEERGPGNVSGRSRTVWVDPSDTTGKTWFVGSAGGGVWKTSDAGLTYENKTPDLPHLGTSAIMGCKNQPNVIYAGSGEGFNFLSPAGAGVFKSVDGGESWSVLSATTNDQSFANIFRIAVHPDNPDIVFVSTRNDNSLQSTEGFVMRSKDGGESWEEVLYHFDAIPHVLMNPENPEILFAGLNQEGVLRSLDGGDNWDFVYMYENAPKRPGRIELAIAPSDPNYVYFTTPIEGEDKIFLSDNGGDSFFEVIPNDPTEDYYGGFSGGQSFWNKAIGVNPFNPLQFYFAGQSAMLKMDIELIPGLPIGFLSVVSDGYGAYSDVQDVGTKGVHVDHHGITFSITDAANEKFILINTNDGGVAVSHDEGATFSQTGDTFLKGFNPEEGDWTTVSGYNVSTFYGVDKMNGADRYVGGTQDNGSWVSGEDPDENSEWQYAPSGDGFEAAWNYNYSNKLIESSQGNNFSRSLDGGATWEALPTPNRGPFITAIANSKQDGDMVVISTNRGPALSNDFGDNWYVSDMPEEYVFSGLRTPVDISLADPSIVWTGTGMTESNRLCVSTDGGYNYRLAEPYWDAEMGEVAGIATHPTDINTAYATFGVAKMPKILKTTDLGQSWEDISGFIEGDSVSTRGFPDVSVYSLLVMPYNTDIIWAGTEIGVVESTDGGASWNLIVDALPSTAVWEMKIVNDEVILATHGRGIWTASLPELEGYEPTAPSLLSSILDGHLFDKKLKGEIVHRSAIDSGYLTLTVDIDGEEVVREFAFGQVDGPSTEELDLSFEDIESGDRIYDAIISTTIFKDGESRYFQKAGLFYDVDYDDVVDVYSNDFDSDKPDFAVGIGSELGEDFTVKNLSDFSTKALVSVQNPNEEAIIRTILQKPIEVSSEGTRLSFDEVLVLNAGFQIGEGEYFYFESAILEATVDEGKTWVRIDEYSSEQYPDWREFSQSGTFPTEEAFRNRSIFLSDFFDVGDKVFFKWEFNVSGFFSTNFGWVIDNVTVDMVSDVTDGEILQTDVTVLNNPFIAQTKIQIVTNEPNDVNHYILTNLSGQKVKANIVKAEMANGLEFTINGDRLPSGTYLFHANLRDQKVTEKLIKI